MRKYDIILNGGKKLLSCDRFENGFISPELGGRFVSDNEVAQVSLHMWEEPEWLEFHKLERIMNGISRQIPDLSDEQLRKIKQTIENI